MDGLEADALGKLNVSREGMRQRNHLVFEAAQMLEVPLVVFMGGGYAKPIDASLNAFDLFTDAAAWNDDTVYKGPMETPVNSTVPTMTPAPARLTVV